MKATHSTRNCFAAVLFIVLMSLLLNFCKSDEASDIDLIPLDVLLEDHQTLNVGESAELKVTLKRRDEHVEKDGNYRLMFSISNNGVLQELHENVFTPETGGNTHWISKTEDSEIRQIINYKGKGYIFIEMVGVTCLAPGEETVTVNAFYDIKYVSSDLISSTPDKSSAIITYTDTDTDMDADVGKK
jgi:hypothetical protein